MNYTDLVREEILNNIGESKGEKLAFLTGVTKSLASLQLFKNNAFSLEYEFKDEALAMKTYELLKELFDVELDLGFVSQEVRIYTITIAGNHANLILKEMGLSHYEGDEFVLENNTEYVNNISNLVKAQSYFQGVFASLGTVYFPEGADIGRGYHIEIVFSEEDYALAVQSMLNECNINLTYIDRDSTVALYAKSSVVVSDVLALVKAMQAVMKLNDINIQREMNNMVNRESNLLAANVDKTLQANLKYIAAIEKVKNSGLYVSLDDKTKQVCEARYNDKQSSMSQLSQSLNMTKSSLNRVLNKILDMANGLK